ncbi:MAG: hypothetical protein IJX80_11150 [Clostridia bacterium]|nr:hypothetical protein [Clostridia bacterium]
MGKSSKKPLLIAAVGAGIAAITVGLGKAFRDMKASAKAQHEVDKAEFAAVKAESKANFEENRGHNTFAKAKADAKKNWDDAHMSTSERAAKEQEARDARIVEAKARAEEANARYEAAKKQ